MTSKGVHTYALFSFAIFFAKEIFSIGMLEDLILLLGITTESDLINFLWKNSFEMFSSLTIR